MLNFIVMTISIALGIVLAMGVMLVIMLQPCVLKWYYKQTMKMIETMTSTMTDVLDTETEAK